MKKMYKVFLLAASAVVMAMAMAGCGKTKVDVMNDVYVTFSGMDGEGKAEIRFSKEDPSDYTPEFLYDLMDAGKLAANDWEKLLTIGNAVTYTVEPEYGLGKNASEPSDTPSIEARYALISSSVSGSGREVKSFCQFPSAQTSSSFLLM